MTFLTRDQILNASDLRPETVAVPEWGGSVLVRGLNGAERDAFEASLVQVAGGKVVKVQTEGARARLVSLCVVDEQGNRLFSDADIEALSKKSGAALDRVFEAAQKLSGLGKGAAEEAGKNS